MKEAAEVLVIVIGLAALCWAAWRIEPHWSSKNGDRFIARAQLLGANGTPDGGWKEVRGRIEGDIVVLTTRGARAGRLRGRYRVASKSADPPARRAVYLLSGQERVVLRMPRSSRSVAVLDRLTT